MPNEDTNAPAGQEPEGAPEGQEPTSDNAPPAGGDGQVPGENDSPLDSLPPEVQRMVRDLRQEAAGYRTRLREFEAAEEERRQAEMTELERERAAREAAESELTEMRERLQEGRDRQSVTETAMRLGFRNPQLAYQLLDRTQLERDGDGQPTNVETLLGALLEADPYLADDGRPAPVGADAGAGRRGDAGTGTGDMNHRLRKAARRG